MGKCSKKPGTGDEAKDAWCILPADGGFESFLRT